LQGVVGRWRAGFDMVFLQLGLEVSDVGAQVRVLRLHGLRVAAYCGASGDSVGGATWRPVLLAWCASFGSAVAADLAHLWWLLVCLFAGRHVRGRRVAMTSQARRNACAMRLAPLTW
jgi:hypothetical protein